MVAFPELEYPNHDPRQIIARCAGEIAQNLLDLSPSKAKVETIASICEQAVSKHADGIPKEYLWGIQHCSSVLAGVLMKVRETPYPDKAALRDDMLNILSTAPKTLFNGPTLTICIDVINYVCGAK